MNLLRPVSLFFLLLVGFLRLGYGASPKWAVTYSDQPTLEELDPYSLLVLDSHYHPSLETLKTQKKLLLGYLSLGEVEKDRPYYNEVRAEGILLMENRNWKGSYFVDVRAPRWVRRVIEDLIPAILHQGFDGLFLDTMDNPGHLERTDPAAYKGMTQAAVNLLLAIRTHYPNLPVMLNRGYDLYEQGGGYVDMVLGESVFGDYDFSTQTYRLVPKALYQEQLRILKDAQKRYPKLQVYTLDYWDPKDREGIKRIYQEQRNNGFNPYVSTIALDKVIPEPR